MGLSLENWKELSESEKIKVVEFLKDNCRIDRELAEAPENRPNAYIIKEGVTSGGFPKKYGDQYRINITDITDIPEFLAAELKEPGKRNRIGGSKAIREIMDFGGFRIGRN
ncbi:hypothetical protein LMK04_00475 [Lactococcus petauri]|nr:hypothetical protein LMK04_00475 [Lactococcus petauri]